MLDQAHRTGLDRQGPFTVMVVRTLGGEIQRVADGGEPSQQLLELVQRICNTPLDEWPSEGVKGESRDAIRKVHV